MATTTVEEAKDKIWNIVQVIISTTGTATSICIRASAISSTIWSIRSIGNGRMNKYACYTVCFSSKTGECTPT